MTLVDTSGWMAVLNAAEPEHGRAAELRRDAELLLTHSYILAELVALGRARRLPGDVLIAFSAAILDDPAIEVVFVDRQLHTRAVALLQRRRDKTYSLCDAVSFVLMNDHGLVEALTTDRHFEQEGLTRLLAI